MPRSPITATAAAAVGPYSHGIDTGSLVFLSGQTPQSADGRLVEGDIAAQTRQCLDSLFAVLAAGGLTSADVVKCNVFLTNMVDFAAMNEVYAGAFDLPYPARTTIQVAGLPLGANVEIELIAQRPTRHPTPR